MEIIQASGRFMTGNSTDHKAATKHMTVRADYIGMYASIKAWHLIKVAYITKEEATAQANAWLVLRNKTRLRIINLLKKYGCLLCVVEIAEVLEENPSVISSHLAVLRVVNLVVREEYGNYAYYRLAEGVLEKYQNLLERL